MIRLFISCLISTIIWADETVNVTVDRRDIIEGDSITLTVTASNVKSDPEVRLPDMPDFKVVSGPNQSSSTNVQFLNGKMTKSSTTTLRWSLIPQLQQTTYNSSVENSARKEVLFINSPL